MRLVDDSCRNGLVGLACTCTTPPHPPSRPTPSHPPSHSVGIWLKSFELSLLSKAWVAIVLLNLATEEMQVVVTDSVLSSPDGRNDNGWLGISGEVSVHRGRTFCKQKHNWSVKLADKARQVVLIMSGNDFKQPGPRAKGSLPSNFNEKVAEALQYWGAWADEVTFVVWGDWATWREGFLQDQPDDGDHYDEFCRHCFEFARDFHAVQVHAVWLRHDDVGHLRLYDGWHIAAEAKHDLQAVLRRLGVSLNPVAGGSDGRRDLQGYVIIVRSYHLY